MRESERECVNEREKEEKRGCVDKPGSCRALTAALPEVAESYSTSITAKYQ